MSGGILLAGEELDYLSELACRLTSVSRSVTISCGQNPVRRLFRVGLATPDAAIVCLDGAENIGDVRSVLRAHRSTTFLFLSRATPPRSALVHAIHVSGGEIVSRSAGPLVIVATLVAMLAQRAWTLGAP